MTFQLGCRVIHALQIAFRFPKNIFRYGVMHVNLHTFFQKHPTHSLNFNTLKICVIVMYLEEIYALRVRINLVSMHLKLFYLHQLKLTNPCFIFINCRLDIFNLSSFIFPVYFYTINQKKTL